MKTLLCSLVTSAAALGAVHAQTEAGFTSLFDGKTLNGWKAVNQRGNGFGVTNGAIFCATGETGRLFTEKQYGDFVLRFEFKLSPGANNGIGIRAPLEGDAAYVGMEVQVLDDTAPKYASLQPWQYHGAIYGAVPASRAPLKPAGEWNDQEISAIGRHLKVTVNGKTIVDTNLNEIADPATIQKHPGLFRSAGHIGFLGHNDYVEFRNVRIREIAGQTAEAPAGFESLFNGKNLEGWKGLVGDPVKRAKMSPAELSAAQMKANELMRKNWLVEDGALVYRGNDFENICTEKEYGNFELLADWKIAPQSDSGVYVRGTPQIQIWDPFTQPTKNGSEVGSGGLYNNKTNPSKPLKVADQPVGEWNRFRILMAGEKVHVFLNDELVVNNVTLENFWERGQPVYASGPIEFQAHQTPVWFRNIYIRELSNERK